MLSNRSSLMIGFLMCATAASAAPDGDRLTTSAREKWVETDLGPQITFLTVLSAAFTPAAAGNMQYYAALTGNPAQLATGDVHTTKPTRMVPVPGAEGSYSVIVSTSGDVYLGTYPNGNLYRYKPGAGEVENLGRPAPDVEFIWDIVEGPAGKIYCACYPKSRVVEYDPATGKFRDFGPAVEGEDYARCIVWHAKLGKIYVGVGSHSALIELDPATGVKRNILPEEWKGTHFVYNMDIVGEKLVVKIDPSNKGAIFDPATGKVEMELPEQSGALVSPASPADGRFYFTSKGELIECDPAKQVITTVTAGLNGHGRAFAWSNESGPEGPALLCFSTNGKLLKYRPADKSSETIMLDLPPQPVGIQSIHAGPDGNIYSSGYVVGGTGVYNPRTGTTRQFKGISQAEGIAVLGTRMYFGVYPRARFIEYDTAAKAPDKKPQSRELFTLYPFEQDRPFGMLGVEEENRLYIGTVSGYGLLGGALAVHDFKTSMPEVYRNVVPGQSVVSLAYKDGLLYGGTTISGGLGVKPTEKEGGVFIWDPKLKKKIHQFVPVPNRRAVTCLKFAPDGKLWGFAEGDLFIYDLEQKKVEFVKTLVTSSDPDGHMWRSAAMTDAKDGVFYAMVMRKLFRIDIGTREAEQLATGGEFSLIAVDDAGAIYFSDKDRLVKIEPRAAK